MDLDNRKIIAFGASSDMAKSFLENKLGSFTFKVSFNCDKILLIFISLVI